MYVNLGPSYNTMPPVPRQLSGFSQRFMMQQNDPRWTPGKKEPHFKQETMKGTFKLGKANRAAKRLRCTEQMPKGNPTPIYSGYDNIKNLATRRIVKKPKTKLRKRKAPKL